MSEALRYLEREIRLERENLERSRSDSLGHAMAMDMIRFFERRLEVAKRMEPKPSGMPAPGFWADRDVLVDVVIYHRKTDIKGCSCGWAKLGESWAEHVADLVAERSAHLRGTE